jgi:predicted DNA-binding transcriptional regulator
MIVHKPGHLPEQLGSVTSLQEFLSVGFEDLDPLSLFATTVDTVLVEWHQRLWKLAQGPASRLMFDPIVAELAVIPDPRLTGIATNHFVSNIVCREPRTADGSTPVLDAYLAAIEAIGEGAGTTMGRPDFHRLHCVHVYTDAKPYAGNQRPNDIDFSWRQRQVPREKPAEEANESAFDFFGHHQKFFTRFLDGFGKTLWKDAQSLHYLCAPFRRPAVVSASSAPEGPLFEAAGAFYLILVENLQNREEVNAKISLLALMLQHLCANLVLRESCLLLDVEQVQRAAYNNIGHTLHSFVNTTAYRDARKNLRGIRKTLKETEAKLSREQDQALDEVIESMDFFSHVEALGSLMRLNGWIGYAKSTSAANPEKILKCFKASVEDVRAAMPSEKDDITIALFFILSDIAQQLGTRHGVQFYMPQIQARYPEGVSRKERQFVAETPELPPLQDHGDEAAVRYAIMVSLFEPLRNAAKYLEQNELKADPVQIYIQREEAGVSQVYIGNRVLSENAASLTVDGSSGLSLIQHLLKNCRLGDIKVVEGREVHRLFPGAGDHLRNESYAWVNVTLTPIALYDFARRRF